MWEPVFPGKMELRGQTPRRCLMPIPTNDAAPHLAGVFNPMGILTHGTNSELDGSGWLIGARSSLKNCSLEAVEPVTKVRPQWGTRRAAIGAAAAHRRCAFSHTLQEGNFGFQAHQEAAGASLHPARRHPDVGGCGTATECRAGW